MLRKILSQKFSSFNIMLVFLMLITYFETVINFKIPVQNAELPPQFAPHTDLLKLGEVTFRGEQYKVLKPTIHEVKDHFAEVMTRQKNAEVPNSESKVFIDKNGFRHSWSGFEDEKKYLKTSGVKVPPEVREELLVKYNILRNGTKPTGNSTSSRPSGNSTTPSPGAPGDFIQTSFYCPFFGIMTMLTKI